MALALALPDPLVERSSPGYVRLVMEPLESGFGTTLGHAVKRILISALEGAALTSAQILEGALDGDRIEHVREPLPELLLNLSEVRLTAHGNGRRPLRLHAEGEGPVFAGDIQPDAVYEIANPEAPLATLTDQSAALVIALEADTGRGYIAATSPNGAPPDAIPLDVRFTPVERAHYQVTRTRVGQHTNYDRLVLDVWTDQHVDAKQAIADAAAMFRASLFPLRTLSGDAPLSTPPMATVPDLPLPPMDTSAVETLGLSMRTNNALSRAGLTTVESVLVHPREDLLALRGFGETAYQELRVTLLDRGYPDLDVPPPGRRIARP